jgi:hypothetical protein
VTVPVGLPNVAFPLTSALSLLPFPITMLELAGVVVVAEDAKTTNSETLFTPPLGVFTLT